MAAMANIPGRLAPDIGAVAVADFTLEFKRQQVSARVRTDDGLQDQIS